MGRFLTESGTNYGANGNKPKAYLNFVLFDEQFNIVWTGDGRNSGFSQVGGDDAFTPHDVVGREMKKTGYLYVYVSNETPNIDVFFDNVQVTHERGALMEETHYYPFGLTMAGISSKAAGKLQNKFKYSGKELQSDEFCDGSGLELYDFTARMQDLQLGRWWAVDPMSDKSLEWSPYVYGKNNPVVFIDPTGMFDVRITGLQPEKAFDELQVSVQGQLNLTKDATGNVSYEVVKDAKGNPVKLNSDAQQLTAAINDHTVEVEVFTTASAKTPSGSLIIGGGFNGNTVKPNGNVEASQVVNPYVLSNMSKGNGKPGADMLHEVTESYQGALISQQAGVSSPASNMPGTVYNQAHVAATKQSGNIYRDFFDNQMKKLQSPPGGATPPTTANVQWYVLDASGNKTIIQTLP
jgi:RHS repeat-associated protein